MAEENKLTALVGNEKLKEILQRISKQTEEITESDLGVSKVMLGILLENNILELSEESDNGYKINITEEQLAEAIETAEDEKIREEIRKREERTQQSTFVSYNKAWIEEWKTLLEDGTDMVAYWAQRINPKILKLEYEKTAALLSLASVQDRFGDRGRIHVLLYGEPGTAKSAIGDWLVHNLGIFGASHRTTDVGLTADVSGNEITIGALPQADGNAIYIDEVEKFRQKRDWYGLLESMEEGEIIITAGKTRTRLSARCRVIASANTIDKLPPELIDRFDFKVEMHIPELEEEKEIIVSVIDSWRREKAEYYGEKLRGYLEWIKNYEPEINEETREVFGELMQMFIDLNEEVRGSMRKKESLLRVVSTVAKLNRREVQTDDFIRAVEMLYPKVNGGMVKSLQILKENIEEKKKKESADPASAE